MSQALSDDAALRAGSALIHREAMLLDERRWDDWLALYLPDCRYWAPMWSDDGTLGADPASTLSHLYYDSRKGLEDRVARIRSARRAPAATPLPRTAHLVSNLLLLSAPAPEALHLRSTWACHVLMLRTRRQHVFFGWCEWRLADRGDGWRIAERKVTLQNDDIPTMLDVYCL